MVFHCSETKHLFAHCVPLYRQGCYITACITPNFYIALYYNVIEMFELHGHSVLGTVALCKESSGFELKLSELWIVCVSSLWRSFPTQHNVKLIYCSSQII